MPGFILIGKCPNKDALVRTLELLPGAGRVHIVSANRKGEEDEAGEYERIWVTGDPSFVKFAIQHQGYADVLECEFPGVEECYLGKKQEGQRRS